MSHNKSVSGGISGKLFAIGKWFSLFFALLALIAIVFGVVYMLSLGSAFKVPSFDDQARQTMISNMSQQQSNIAQQKEQVKLNAEYGDKVISIISKYGIQDVKTAGIINTLMQLPAKYREDFISGWRTYLREGVAYAKKTGVYQAIGNSDGTPGTADMLTQQYINEFSSAVEAANAEKTKSKIERLVIFSLIISAMIIFILTMILPVLVQIEKNTRGISLLGDEAPASASDAASLHVSAQQAAALCPKCRAPITPGDLFCGSCGADLR
ncbi:MAG: zinc ribbon domain-containing protein [Acidithiobacillus sp.]|nr:zinc ribbon domain-containing protein [Acidithiobacillus sp.]